MAEAPFPPVPASGDVWGQALIDAVTSRTSPEAIAGKLPARLSDEELSATYVRGKAGKKYALVSGVMRNPGAGWEVIVDADHQGDSNVDSVSIVNGAAVINYAALGVTKVVSFTATPDEALSNNGVRVGASVTPTAASIFFTQDMSTADYIYYDGAAWVSSTASYTMSFSAGVLTITHTKKMLGTLTSSDITLSPRGGVLRPVVSTASGATSATGAKIEFFTNAGALQTTPTTDMKVFVSQAAHGYVNAANVNETNFPFSNVWFMGIFETA